MLKTINFMQPCEGYQLLTKWLGNHKKYPETIAALKEAGYYIAEDQYYSLRAVLRANFHLSDGLRKKELKAS